jgi:hypothetical protein
MQALELDDRCLRKEFVVDMLDPKDNDSGFLARVIFSDRSTFQCVMVNRHNCRIRGSEPPHVISEYDGDSPRLNVWCALSRHKASGPVSF